MNDEFSGGYAIGRALKALLAKEWIKVFLAFAALIGGVICVFGARFVFYYDLSVAVAVVVGVLLIAGGATYFWMNSRFHKR